MKVFYRSFLLFCLWASLASADPVVMQTGSIVTPRFDEQVSWFLDDSRRYDRDQSGLLSESFQPGTRPERTEVGFTSGILWCRFQLLHDFSQAQNLVLSFHHANFTRLRLFEVKDGRLQEIIRQGSGYTRSEQSFHALGTNMPIKWVAPGLHDFVIAAESHGGRLGLAFTIAPAAIWIEQLLFPQYFGKGIFYGTLFTLLLFHFFVFINNRDRAYGRYVFYIIALQLLFLNIDGILDHLLPIPEFGGWAVYSAPFAALVLVTVMLVNKTYFDSQARFPRINALFNINLLLGVLIIVMTPFVPIDFLSRSTDLASAIGIITVFACSAYLWLKGFRPAKYLFIARLLFAAFAGVFMLHLYGFFPDAFIVEYSLQIGCLCDTLIMSYGLGVRMRLLEVEKAEAREGERQASFKLNWFNTLVRVITHDLSTPVSVITATTDMELRREQPSKSLQKNLERIARASKQQANLINHVRDMIAVASGKKELELKSVCLNEALEEAIHSLAEMAEKKRIQFDLISPKNKVFVAADPTALVSTVLDNFLSNAIKFSESGSAVRLELAESPSVASIKITDSGIGIPPELIDHLFDPAHATSRPGTEREMGTGFGLPLAKVYIEQFHGRILVDSHTETTPTAPRGTCFTIELPLLPIPVAS